MVSEKEKIAAKGEESALGGFSSIRLTSAA